MNHKNIVDSLIWRFLERCGSQGIMLVVGMVLARLLGPDAFGTLALVMVFTTILNVFVNCGLGTALIQKKDADDLDFSSVFYCNIFFCLVLYIGLYFCSPIIADFYQRPELVSITRVLGLILIISGVRNVQGAYISRHLLFRIFFLATMISSILAAVAGLWMAYKGFGVWALVVQQLFTTGVGTLVLWAFVHWRPRLMFSMQRLKRLFSYGWKLLVSSLIDRTYMELRSLIIGKIYTVQELAFYNRGHQIPNLITNNINDSIDSVIFPVMSKAQTQPANVKDMTQRAIQMSTCIMSPMMLGVAAAAVPFVHLVLGDKWMPCVPFLRISCVTMLFRPINSANLNAMKALGRSDLFLKLEIIKKIVGLLLILCSMWFGVLAMAYTLLIQSFLSQLINTWPNRKLLNYRYIDQMKDILPYIMLATCMALIVYPISFLHFHDVFLIMIQAVTGILLYLGGLIVFRLECYTYIKGMIQQYQKKY